MNDNSEIDSQTHTTRIIRLDDDEVHIPTGWEVVRLTDLVDSKRPFCYGVVQPGDNDVCDGVPLIRVQDLNRGTVITSDLRTISKEIDGQYKRSRVRGGDLLISVVGTIGRTAIVPFGFEGNIARAIARVACREEIDPRWVRYWLSCHDVQWWLVKNSREVARKTLNLSELGSTPVPLPSGTEQKRITDKLDALLGRVDTCRERLKHIPQLMKRFRLSVLYAAASGSLTEDWRLERNIDHSTWAEATIGELVTSIEAGLNVLCEERPPNANQRGLVKISAVSWGEFNEEESKTLPVTTEVRSSNRIREGDLLISRANTIELVGACVIVAKVTKELYLSDKVLRLTAPDVIKNWLFLWLTSPQGRVQIESLSSGNQLSMRNLSQANLRSIKVLVPSLEEVNEIVQRVQRLFGNMKNILAVNANALAYVESLSPSILAKAFRGELVPHDKSDEPAGLLIETLAVASDVTIKQKRKVPKKETAIVK